MKVNKTIFEKAKADLVSKFEKGLEEFNSDWFFKNVDERTEARGKISVEDTLKITKEMIVEYIEDDGITDMLINADYDDEEDDSDEG